eukprot:284818965_6
MPQRVIISMNTFRDDVTEQPRYSGVGEAAWPGTFCDDKKGSIKLPQSFRFGGDVKSVESTALLIFCRCFLGWKLLRGSRCDIARSIVCYQYHWRLSERRRRNKALLQQHSSAEARYLTLENDCRECLASPQHSLGEVVEKDPRSSVEGPSSKRRCLRLDSFVPVHSGGEDALSHDDGTRAGGFTPRFPHGLSQTSAWSDSGAGAVARDVDRFSVMGPNTKACLLPPQPQDKNKVPDPASSLYGAEIELPFYTPRETPHHANTLSPAIGGAARPFET